jgi:site-specific DNA-methyltransferase (cytosine-N4-specific)
MQRRAIYSRAKDIEGLITSGQEWNFHHADTMEYLHSLHPYPAKFIPQIPRKAIEEFTDPGDLVLDPLCGCGTTLLEASLMQRPSIGVDNNPVAILISQAKTAEYSEDDLAMLRSFSSDFAFRASSCGPRTDLIPSDKNFAYWFSEEVLLRLSAIKGLILERPDPVRTILMAIFSSIIVRVSYQDSDTRYSNIKRIVKIEQVDKAFKSKLDETIERLPEIIVPHRSQVKLFQADSRCISFVDDGSVSLIVTSPPYLNAYDYHKYHRQRIHWVDGDVEFARNLEIGKHDEFTKPGAKPDKYFKDMEACFREWSRVLRKGGKCIIVIGDAIVSKEPVYVADTFVDLMNNCNLQLEKRWIRELQPTKRSFNVGNSRISHEHVLLFIKHGSVC